MKITIFHAARVAVLLALGSAYWAGLSAQEVVHIPPVVREASEPSSSDSIRFNLDFPGGTVVEFVDAIGKARGTPVNVVIPEELKTVMMPDMKMTQVDARALFEAASTALVRTVRFSRRGLSGSEQRGYVFRTVRDGVWSFIRLDTSDDDSLTDQSVVFFNLEPYLGQYSIDDIITVIEAGNQLRPNNEPLSLKFHKETKLLVVRGTPEDLNLVKGALNELGRKAPPLQTSEPVTGPTQPK